MPITMKAETTAGSRRRGSWRRSALGAFALLLAAAALAACDPDSPDPTAPGGSEGPDPSAVTLQSNELDSGGTGVVVSDGFVQLELEPAVDDDGAIIPDRWTNLRVTVGGRDADVRRLDERTMEFTVPIVPGGTYGVDVASPFAHGSASARVFGVVASERVMGCFVYPSIAALIPVGDALIFDTHCRVIADEHQGVGVTWPSVPGRGFEWLPEGEVDELSPWVFAGPSHRPNHFVARRSGASAEFWVWEAGRTPQPVEPLDCFGPDEIGLSSVAPAEVAGGTCLLIAPYDGVILRDGEPVDGLSGFLDLGHFVMSDDGWVTTRNSSKLVVFDAAGELVVNDDVEFIRDARFAPGGGPLYLATGDRSVGHDAPPEATLMAIDRATGDVLRETTLPGTVTALAVSEDRLWIARTTGRGLGAAGELFVELLDPETLEIRRSIAVARDLAPGLGRILWPYHGLTPVLLEDATGTRLTYTGLPQDWAGLWTHVVEVG